MNWFELLVRAVRQDRLLQIGLGAFAILSLMLFQTLSQNSIKGRQYAPGPDGRAPVVITMSSGRAAAEKSVRAMITGRAVVLVYPDGSSRRIEPQIGPDGKVQDMTTTLEGAFKLVCTEESRSDLEKMLADKSDEERQRLEKSRETFCKLSRPD